ncbi:MAG: MATE family efflux transporter [Clostridiales bacterium]|nr:MATE family efflux transporter [Clostridiales bacterium]
MNVQPATKERKRIDFSTGTPWQKILLFAYPLMLSSVLQQLYNTVSGIIVGRGVSHVGLAAVGLSAPFLRVLTSFFMGISLGGNVLVAQHYGAKDQASCMRTVNTATILAVATGIVLSTVGILISPLILRWLNAPADLYAMALTYMRIIFSGIVFQLLYNMMAGFLRGMGESKIQLFVLAVTSVVNAVLCWVFVIFFKWGIAGAAAATVISQFLSVALLYVRLQNNPWTSINVRKLAFYATEAKAFLKIGLPTGIQQVTMSLTGMIVMGFITAYGTASIAGNSIGNTVDMYLNMPVSALNMSVAPFTAQNIGAGRMDRVYKGTKQVILLILCISTVLGSTVLFFKAPLLRMFTDNEATIAAGSMMLNILVPVHLITAISSPLGDTIRGSGDTVTIMINGLMTAVVVRIPVLIALNQVFGRIEVVYFSHVISQLYGLVFLLIIFNKGKWKKNALQRIESLHGSTGATNG